MNYKIILWVIAPCLMWSFLAAGNVTAEASDEESKTKEVVVPSQIIKEANQIVEFMNANAIGPVEAYVMLTNRDELPIVLNFGPDGRLKPLETTDRSAKSGTWEIIGFEKQPLLRPLLKDRWLVVANFHQKKEGNVTTRDSIRWTNRQSEDKWVVEGFEDDLRFTKKMPDITDKGSAADSN